MLLFWLLLAVPSAPPKITSAYKTSSTSISVHWTPIPENVTNGILLGYRIRYVPFLPGFLPVVKTTNASSTSCEQGGLKKFTFYFILVSGYTNGGSGAGGGVLCRTAEDGKDYNN